MNHYLEELRRRPLLVIGGLVGLFALVTLANRVGGGMASPADGTDATTPPDPTTDPSAVPSPDQGTGFIDPSAYGGGYGSSFDPFGGYDPSTGYSQAPPSYTADGCLLPKPAVPAAYQGQGDYVCDGVSKSWTWKWNKPQTTKGGCLLPKPTPPAQYIGQGDYECNPTTHKWDWKWKTTKPPKQTRPHGEMHIAAGPQRTWSRSNSGPATDPKTFTHTGVTVLFHTSAKAKVKLPDKSSAELVRITAAPGHTNLVGRWMRPTSDWTWKTS